MQPPARKIPKTLVSLFGVLALLVASAATSGAQETDPAANTSTIGFGVDCDAGTVTVTTSKDLSNVKFFDGGTQVAEHDGLSGSTNTFALVEGADRVTAKAGVSETGTDIDCSEPEEAPAPAPEDPEEDVEPPVVEDEDEEIDGNQGSSAVVGAVFDCTSVVVSSTKDLSNVVLQFADGTVQKFDGLSGHDGTFAGTGANDGALITGVWIKSGNNASGDGPGYGEFVAGSIEDCDDNGVGSGGDGEIPGPGDGTDDDEAEQGADKVTICHATGSDTNPYVIITIAKQAVLNGHLDHQDGRDIIPAFDEFLGQPEGQGPITSIEDCPSTDVDDDDGGNGVDAPVLGFANVEAVCVAGVHTTITFDLTSDVDDTFTVVLLDDGDEIDEVDVHVVDGTGSESFAFPTEHVELSLAVTVGDETVSTLVAVGTCPPVTTPGDENGDDTGEGFTPPIVGGDTEVPGPGDTPVVDDTPMVDETPAVPGADVEGDEVVTDVVVPVTTFRPVVQPAGPVVVDQPTVMGDVTTRTVAGQLPRTGSDTAAGLAPFGLMLLLAGFALQRTGRRRSTIG